MGITDVATMLPGGSNTLKRVEAVVFMLEQNFVEHQDIEKISFRQMQDLF